jgi:hypothetical protein
MDDHRVDEMNPSTPRTQGNSPELAQIGHPGNAKGVLVRRFMGSSDLP